MNNINKILIIIIILMQINVSALAEEKCFPNKNPSDIKFNNAFPDKNWWTRFKDPLLAQYIGDAVNSNLDLAIAKERIQEAQAIAKESRSFEFPQLSAGVSFSEQRVPGTSLNIPKSNTLFSVPLNVTYEADIWRKNRDITKAANKQTEAVSRDYQTAYIILVTEVASAYFNLLTADQLIELQKEVISTAKLDLANSQRRFDAGLVDNEDVVLRQERLTDYEAQLQDFYQIEELSLHQLAILMGKTPAQLSELEREDWNKYKIPTDVDAGVSSELIVRRPDILAEESRLEASGLLVKAARKEFLPSIILNGEFGYTNNNLTSLFDWGNPIASITTILTQNIFAGGRLKANLKIYKSRYEQQLLSYHSTILQALKEVDDSISSLNSHKNSHKNYEASLISLQERLEIQQNRLKAGSISEGDVNPVLLEVYIAQEGLARTKLAALTDILSLYKSLGGGY